MYLHVYTCRVDLGHPTIGSWIFSHILVTIRCGVSGLVTQRVVTLVLSWVTTHYTVRIIHLFKALCGVCPKLAPWAAENVEGHSELLGVLDVV